MQSNKLVDERSSPLEAHKTQEPERFVDSVVAANFLSIERQMLMRLARQGKIPAYPLGDGQRRIWRFRLSELAKAMEQRMTCGESTGETRRKELRPIRGSRGANEKP